MNSASVFVFRRKQCFMSVKCDLIIYKAICIYLIFNLNFLIFYFIFRSLLNNYLDVFYYISSVERTFRVYYFALCMYIKKKKQ